MTVEKQMRDVSQLIRKINKHAVTAPAGTGSGSSHAENDRFPAP